MAKPAKEPVNEKKCPTCGKPMLYAWRDETLLGVWCKTCEKRPDLEAAWKKDFESGGEIIAESAMRDRQKTGK